MRELLFSVTKRDLVIQTFTSGGKGGQHQNRVQTGVRITHKESGAVGEARDTKSQHTNMKNAFRRLVAAPSFRIWQARKILEIMDGRTTEQKIAEMLDPRNVKTEVRGEHGRWEVVE